MLISTLNCEMWPNFSYRGVRSVQLLLLLLLLMVFSSENFGFSPPYAGIAGIGPGRCYQRFYIHVAKQVDILILIWLVIENCQICEFRNKKQNLRGLFTTLILYEKYFEKVFANSSFLD